MYSHIKARGRDLAVNQQLLFEIKPVAGDKIQVGIVDVIERDDPDGSNNVGLIGHANLGDDRFDTKSYLWAWMSATPEGAKQLFPYLAQQIDEAVDEGEPVEVDIVNPKVHVGGKQLRARIQVRESIDARESDFDLLDDGSPRFTRTLKRVGRNGDYLVTGDGYSIFRRLRLVGVPESDDGEAPVRHKTLPHAKSQPGPGLVRFEGEPIRLDLITFESEEADAHTEPKPSTGAPEVKSLEDEIFDDTESRKNELEPQQ